MSAGLGAAVVEDQLTSHKECDEVQTRELGPQADS